MEKSAHLTYERDRYAKAYRSERILRKRTMRFDYSNVLDLRINNPYLTQASRSFDMSKTTFTGWVSLLRMDKFKSLMIDFVYRFLQNNDMLF